MFSGLSLQECLSEDVVPGSFGFVERFCSRGSERKSVAKTCSPRVNEMGRGETEIVKSNFKTA